MLNMDPAINSSTISTGVDRSSTVAPQNRKLMESRGVAKVNRESNFNSQTNYT